MNGTGVTRSALWKDIGDAQLVISTQDSPSDSSGKDFGVVDIMTIGKKTFCCTPNGKRRKYATECSRAVDDFSADGFVQQQRRRTVGKNVKNVGQEERESDQLTIDRVGFTWPTSENKHRKLERTRDISNGKTAYGSERRTNAE